MNRPTFAIAVTFEIEPEQAESFETHKRTPHFADYDETVADWVVAKQIRRLRFVGPEPQ